MGKSGWQKALQEEGVSVATPRVSRGSGAMRWFAWFFVIAALTFAGAFYIPLRTAHGQLTNEYRALALKKDDLGQSLQRVEKELVVARDELDTLHAREAEAKSNAEASHGKLRALETTITATLTTALDSKLVSVAAQDDAVVVSFAETAIVDSQKLELTRGARTALCQVANGLREKGNTLEVLTALDVGDGPGTQPWSDAAARAAAIGQVLQSQCRFPAAQIAVRTLAPAGEVAPLRLRVAATPRG